MYDSLNDLKEYKRAGELAKKHWDEIAKPIDSLGLVEEYVVKLCSIAESEKPYVLDKKAVVCLCADHGVVAEGVTQTDSSVTQVVAKNFAKGASTVNHFSGLAGADVFAIDVGMDCEKFPEKKLVCGAVIDRKLRRGSGNLAVESAMTVEECNQALMLGISLVEELKNKGYKIICTGEMGIGNTTPASALAAYILELPANQAVGRGAGLSPDGINKKCEVVEKAVARTKIKYGKCCKDNMIGALAEIGGLEIAAMTGVYLGGIIYKLPIVIDGVISSVAALCASVINEQLSYYALASHVSNEKVAGQVLKRLSLEAILHGKMCLGEGTGAVMLLPVLDMGMKVYAAMGSFKDYEIEAYHRFE